MSPDTSLQDSYRRFSPEFLTEISETIEQRWDSLGTHLNLEPTVLKGIKNRKYICPSTCIEPMLRDWCRDVKEGEPKELLCKALEKVGRNDLKMDIQDKPDMSMDRIIVHIKTRIIPEWQKLGIFLGIRTDKIEMYRTQLQPAPIDKPLALEVLLCWNKCYDGTDRVGELKRALSSIERNDLVEFVNQKLEETEAEVYESPDTSLLSLSLDSSRAGEESDESCCRKESLVDLPEPTVGLDYPDVGPIDDPRTSTPISTPRSGMKEDLIDQLNRLRVTPPSDSPSVPSTAATKHRSALVPSATREVQ